MDAHVTALLPAYRAAAFIQPTLDSLSAQSHRNFDVIVSVDECDDNTFEICTSHARSDPRFRVFRQEHRLNYVGNCNFLLQQATADYVCFAFHDDILFPKFIETLADALDRHEEAILAYSDMLLTDEVTGAHELRTYTALAGMHDPVARGLRLLNGPSGRWSIPNRGLFRLAAARQVGGLRTPGAGGYAPDLPWLFHLSLLGEFVRVPEVLCHKFYKAGSLTKVWRHTEAQMHSASFACWLEIWRSQLTLPQKARLAWPTKWSVRARAQDVLLRR